MSVTESVTHLCKYNSYGCHHKECDVVCVQKIRAIAAGAKARSKKTADDFEIFTCRKSTQDFSILQF